MRATVYIKWFMAAVVAIAMSCGDASELSFDVAESQTHSIPYLKSRFTSSAVTIREAITIRGRVTANDLHGEFSREIVIQDTAGGIAIAIDHETLSDIFPINAQVTVLCNGLTLCEYGGRILLGTAPTEHGAGRIPRNEIARFMRVESPTEALQPLKIDFSEVTPQHIDTYIYFDDVEFEQRGTWCITDPATGRSQATDHTIIDTRGERFTVRAAASCSYAKEHLPEGKCSLYGVIDFFNGRYALRISGYKVVTISAEAPPTTYP